MVKPNSFLARSARLTNNSSGALTAVPQCSHTKWQWAARGQVVRGGTVPEVRMDDDAESLELLEVAIDRRQVDVRGLRLDDRGEVLGAVMPRVVEDGLEEQAPRVRDPPAAFADEGEDVVDRADVVPGCVCAEGNAHDPTTVRPGCFLQVIRICLSVAIATWTDPAHSRRPTPWRARPAESARFATA